jgi:hypothetical protein
MSLTIKVEQVKKNNDNIQTLSCYFLLILQFYMSVLSQHNRKITLNGTLRNWNELKTRRQKRNDFLVPVQITWWFTQSYFNRNILFWEKSTYTDPKIKSLDRAINVMHRTRRGQSSHLQRWCLKWLCHETVDLWFFFIKQSQLEL